MEWKEKLNLHYELGLRSHMITVCHLPLLFDQPDKLVYFFAILMKPKRLSQNLHILLKSPQLTLVLNGFQKRESIFILMLCPILTHYFSNE